ncbi:MAG TPA: efflux RND transporter periplasmic adaptor subunit [Verrucomicrobiae bacterium]|jgi:RND family efflux transporter MFP subunit|nr:efflux RND transporter periplasmic adaptor subunit [Verrucomicrobiae bacterium]
MIDESKRLRIAAPVAAGVMIAIICASCKPGAATDAHSADQAPTVPAARVQRQDLSKIVPIPAEFRPYVEVELHAKVSGYLDKMNVDFGDRVKAGQLLATIEVPELHDELNNALAVERRAEADYTNAHLIYTRLMAVDHDHPNLVAQQDIDSATAKDLAAEAAVGAAKADTGKYRTLVGYTQITAPFDGVITHRYVDPGALVEAGIATENTQPLLEISDNYHLRLDFFVSEEYVQDVCVGNVVSGSVVSMGGKPFSGKITRASLKVNLDTRTMETEIEVANPDLTLVPGMYVNLALPVERRERALSIPIQAVPPGQMSSVYVINDQNEIEERPVTLGLETPDRFEVVSGLKDRELVLIGSRSQFSVGEKVAPKIIDVLFPN